MSDGPHRSLPLGRRRKKVAECLDNGCVPLDDVRARLDAALLTDFAALPPILMTAMRRIFCDAGQGSFAVTSGEIENLRALTDGSALGGLIVDCAVNSVSLNEFGEAALTSALRDASQEWIDRHCRGMDEHYQRKTGAVRAAEFKSRVNDVQNGYSLPQVTRRLVEGGKAMVVKPPKKRSGLNEGVSL